MPLIALVCLFSCNNAKTSKDELIEDKRDVTEISYTKYEEKKVAPDSFKSSLNEPWIKLKYQKDVFNDFQSSYANKLNEVDSLQSESVHVILINKEEKLNKFLTNEKLFRNLEALLIVNTKIDNSTFEKIIEALNSKKYFKKMILFNCEIREVPESIYKIEGLNTLDLAMNKIKELPKSITELRTCLKI